MASRTRQRGGGPVIVVAGPTAAGKSALGILLAERFGGEIISADSVQVYRYMNVGTAKPSLEERARVPHHLIDIVDPDEPYDAGRFERDARAAAAAIHARGRPVFLVGGTGLYIRAFLEGLIESAGADPELRAELEREAERAAREGDPERLHRRLAEIDPEAAARIHPHDRRRIVRALEIAIRTGVPASRLRAQHRFGDRPYRTLYLVLDPGREVLDRRIDARCERMIRSGLLQEVRALRARGYGPELRSMQAIGYRHMAPVVDGLETLDHALRAMQRDTRRFARRQRTWFRGIREAEWLDPRDPSRIVERVDRFLSGSPDRAAREEAASR